MDSISPTRKRVGGGGRERDCTQQGGRKWHPKLLRTWLWKQGVETTWGLPLQGGCHLICPHINVHPSCQTARFCIYTVQVFFRPCFRIISLRLGKIKDWGWRGNDYRVVRSCIMSILRAGVWKERWRKSDIWKSPTLGQNILLSPRAIGPYSGTLSYFPLWTVEVRISQNMPRNKSNFYILVRKSNNWTKKKITQTNKMSSVNMPDIWTWATEFALIQVHNTYNLLIYFNCQWYCSF